MSVFLFLKSQGHRVVNLIAPTSAPCLPRLAKLHLKQEINSNCVAAVSLGSELAGRCLGLRARGTLAGHHPCTWTTARARSVCEGCWSGRDRGTWAACAAAPDLTRPRFLCYEGVRQFLTWLLGEE